MIREGHSSILSNQQRKLRKTVKGVGCGSKQRSPDTWLALDSFGATGYLCERLVNDF